MQDTTAYPKKLAYQGKNAETYEEKRFSSLQGQLIDKMEKRAFFELFNKINLSDRKIVLEIGCGTGRFMKLFVNQASDVIETDISKDMLKMSKRKASNNKNISFILCDAAKLPFRDNSIDGIVAIRFFWIIPYKAMVSIYAEINRVSKRWIIASFSNLMSPIIVTRLIKSITRKKEEFYPLLPFEIFKLTKKMRRIELYGNFIISPLHIPKHLLYLTEKINNALCKTPLKLFSAVYFTLLTK